MTAAAAVALAAFTWWPNGDYRPIRPGERGTIQGGLHSVAAITGGRPSLTTERQRELGGAPTARALKDDRRLKQAPETIGKAKQPVRKRAPRDARGRAGATPTPRAGATPAGTATPAASATPAATATATPTAAATATASPTATPTPTPTPTATPAATATP